MTKFFTILLLSLGLCTASFAQDKIGYFSSSELVGMLPETKVVLGEIEAIKNKKKADVASLETELQAKYKRFEAEKEGMSDLVRNSNIEEIQRLEQKIKAYYEEANKQIGELQAGKMQPIFDKVNAAIKTVAKKNKFTFIIDLDTGKQFLLFVDESRDVMPLMKKELGIE